MVLFSCRVNKETADTDGAYIYAGTEAGEGLTNSLTTPDDGLIIVKGVKTGTYSVTETAAPNGYNKLTAPVTVTATKTGEKTTSTTTYLDENGEVVDQKTEGGSEVLVSIDKLAATPIVVVNKTGTELPSTGGIGTTIFYTIGGPASGSGRPSHRRKTCAHGLHGQSCSVDEGSLPLCG